MHHRAPACLPNQDTPFYEVSTRCHKDTTESDSFDPRSHCASPGSSERAKRIPPRCLSVCVPDARRKVNFPCVKLLIAKVRRAGTDWLHRRSPFQVSTGYGFYMCFDCLVQQKRNKIRQNKLGSKKKTSTLSSLQPKHLFDLTNCGK